MKTFLFRTTLALGVLLFTVSSSWASERVLLANPAGPTLDAAGTNDRAVADKLMRLRTKAEENGNVRLIVGVRTAFAPEGKLAAVEAATQRLDIGKAQAAVLRRLTVVHGREKEANRFKTIPFLALEASAAEFEALASDSDVLSIEEDALRAATLAESSPLIGATSSWATGADGSGQVVAILDTGVDKTHPFLTGKVVSEACYSTNYAPSSSSTVCPGGATESIASGSGVDCGVDCEHGTHVAGIAAGSGETFSGVARGANLIAIQVFSRFVSNSLCGSAVPCILSWDSDQIKGLERVHDLRNSYSIAAVNMSLGGGQYFDQATCDADASNPAVKAAIDNLRSVDIATVISSGNDAYTDSLSAPGCISSAVSVGSTWDAAGWTCNGVISAVDKVACYSNSASFLNLLAPGSAINSSIPGTGFAVFHGTSMAAPQVTGAWALLKQAVPDISVDNALNALTTTGVPVTDYRSPFIVKPRINLVAALAFISVPPYTLTVNSSGASSVAISASPTTYAGTTNYSKTGIAEGTTITLTAPVTFGSAAFSSWKGCDSASDVTCTVNMIMPKTVTAIYSRSLFPWPMFVPAITGKKK